MDPMVIAGRISIGSERGCAAELGAYSINRIPHDPPTTAMPKRSAFIMSTRPAKEIVSTLRYVYRAGEKLRTDIARHHPTVHIELDLGEVTRVFLVVP